jgi:hypothetical protein
VNHSLLNSKPGQTNAAPQSSPALRELVAAIPVVMLATAVVAAFKGSAAPTRAASLQPASR